MAWLGLAGVLYAQDTGPLLRARELVATGRVAEARQLLQAWEPQSAGDRERRLWSLAVLSRDAGDLPAASRALTALVALRPDVGRFRQELAEVLEAMSQSERAAYQAALAGGQRSAQAVLRAEPARAVRLSFAIVPQSNPAERTRTETIDVAGLRLRLAPSARAESATGVRVGARLLWQPELGKDLRARLGLSLSGEFFEETAPDDVSASVDLSLIRATLGGTRLEGGLTFGGRWLDGQLDSYGPGVTLAVAQDVGGRGQLTGAVALRWLTHPASAQPDGRRAAVVLAYRHMLTAQTILRGSVKVEKTDARSAALSFRATELSGGASYIFRGGLTVSGDISLRRASYEAGTRLFPGAREDERRTLRLEVLHSRLNWGGFAPVIAFELVDQVSTVPVYSFRNQGLSLGVTRSF